MNYYLAIDQGSHASRAALYDADGQLVSICMESISLIRSANGHIEHDAIRLLNSVNKALHHLLHHLPSKIKNSISACGLACQRSSVVACNPRGHPLSPVISWQDIRGNSYLDTLPLTNAHVQAISGLPLSPHYGASKCRWLLDHHPHVKRTPKKALYLAPLASFLLLHLLHKPRFMIDHSQAQRMQLMDLVTLNWSKTLMNAFGISPNNLPECKPMCDHYGRLLDTHIPVTAVCGDQNAALFGSGKLPSETALVNLGSGAFILRKLPRLKKSRQQLTGVAYSSHRHKKTTYLREATINGAGNALHWYQQQLTPELRENWHDQLPLWLDHVTCPPLFINTVGGLGSPWWSNSIQPHFIDDQSNVAANAVAIIESILFLIQDNLTLMHCEHPLSVLKLSGGLSRLDGLCQKLANLSGIPVQRSGDKETTARGAAWLASGANTAWKTACVDNFEPMEDNNLYLRYQRFKQLLSALLA